MMSSTAVKELGSRWVLQLDRLYCPVQQGGCVCVISFVQRNLLPSAWPRCAAKWDSSRGILQGGRIWWARQMPVAEWSRGGAAGLVQIPVFPSLRTFSLLSKSILGETSWWESCSVTKGNLRAVSCLSLLPALSKVLLCTQRRLWTSAVSNNL